MIKDAYVRLLDGNTNQELISYRLERRTSNPLLQMRRALSRGCSCQVRILKPHLTCCEAACVHEEVAIADSECLLYEYYPNVTSMTIGELNLHNGQWKFNPVGNGVHQDLAGQCTIYGVEIG